MRISTVSFALATVLFNTTGWAIVNGQAVPRSEFREASEIFIVDAASPTRQGSGGRIVETHACSGAFFADGSLFLTAGHCLSKIKEPKIGFLGNRSGRVKQVPRAIASFTEYTDSVDTIAVPADKEPKNPAGCTLKPQPLAHTESVDLAVVQFPKGTSAHVATLDLGFKPQLGLPAEYVGYGSTMNPFLFGFSSVDGGVIPSGIIKLQGEAPLWRFDEQRLAFKTPDRQAFPANGDSGSPVYVGGREVAVVSTINENCETEFGADYGIETTAVLLSSPEARAFLKRATERFGVSLPGLDAN